ncbi:MAG: glycosyltransferase family 2 protein [Rickettsiales bacterium]|jgi:glycosyltransferase involved in cell wall biosynthesis|nr:glycosyltransferase family 2 protein [Rickettsiales bacterium]
MNEKISVIIPVYNAGKYIRQTLDCICFNTYKNLEVICVLDKPTDDSERIVEEYAKTDERIVVLKQPANRGISAARNLGIKRATGEYMHFMDADDLINMEFYENMLGAAIAAGADAAAGNFYHERVPGYSVFFDSTLVVSTAEDKNNLLQVSSKRYAWRYLIRRAFWLENNLAFPEEMRSMEDAVMFLVIMKTNRVVTVPGAAYIYKHRVNSILTNKNKKHKADVKKNSELADMRIAELMKEYGVSGNPIILKKVKYKTLFNRPIIKKVYTDKGVKVYFLGIRLLKIV